MPADDSVVTAAASPAPPPAPPTGPTPKSPRRWGRRLLWLLAGIVLLVVLGAGALWWSLGSDAGTSWLLSRAQKALPGLVIEGAQGSLRGGDFSARRIEIPLPGEPGKPGGKLALSGVRWSGLKVERLLGHAPYAHLSFKTLEADRADVELPPSSDTKKEPPKPPTSLALPVTVDIDALRIGEVHAAALGDKPVRDLRARVSLGTERHRIEDLSLAWDKLTARGSAQIATGGTLDLDAKMEVSGDTGNAQLGAWTATLGVRGPLARIDTTATLRGLQAPAGASSGTTADAAGAASGGLPASGAASAATGASAAAGKAAAASGAATGKASGSGARVAAGTRGAAASPPGATAAGSAATAPRRDGETPAALPAVDARATLLPFAAWPLGELQARTQALDLAALASGLPTTRIDATANATSSAADQPIGIALDLRNAIPGRWDESRLPVRSARIEARARLDDPSTIDLPTLDIQLGGSAAPGGRLRGSGRWKAPGWTLDLTLADLLPAQLDARAPAMRLSGPVKLRGENFAAATADGSAAGKKPAGGASAAAAPASAAAATGRAVAASTALPSVDIQADLSGELLAVPGSRLPARPLQLALDGRADANDIDIRRFVAASGKARAEGSVQASRAAADAPWRVAGKASLRDFDPAPWLPASLAANWQRGVNRLNANGQWDIALPAAPKPGAAGSAAPAAAKAASGADGRPLAALAGLRGDASLTIADSQLAGLPVKGEATLRSTRSGDTMQVAARLDAAGNRVGIDGLLDLRGDGAADRWKIDAEAPALARLAPVLRLAGLQGPAAELSGALTADARVSGRWPRVSTEGSASARQLQAGGAAGLGVADARLNWQLGTAAGAPARLDLDLTQARAGQAQVDSASLKLQGTAAAHTLNLQAQARGGPPAWVAQVQDALAAAGTPVAAQPAARAPAAGTAAAAPGERTVVSLQARGGLDTSAAPRWRGTLQRLVAGSSRSGRPPWAALQDVDIDVQAAGPRTPARASVAPGRATLLGAALRWDRIAWQGALGNQPQRLEARAEAGPLPVAPILNTLQPEFGWGGDLRIGATAVVRSTPQVHVDVVVQRVSGDLSVTDEAGTRQLGLSDLRLAVEADDGVWRFSQAFAGGRLGASAGAVTVRTSPQAFWPPPEAPMQGVLEAHVDDLGAWGGWIPAGWRLAGRIDTTASIGGRFGAPEIAGSVIGSSLGVRNVLEGINVSDGELKISLAGDTARIERFVFKGGDGTLRIDGSARLGSGFAVRPSPSAPGAPPPVAPPPRAELTVVAERFRLLARVDRRIVVSGRSKLVLDGSKVDLAGRFRVDEGLIDFTRSDAPSLSDDVVVIRTADKPDPNRVEKAPAEPAASPFDVRLDLVVALGDRLRLRGRGIDTGLAGELRITAPGGKLAVNGSVSTVGGTYTAYNQKLNIERGVVTFDGAVANPRLDIQAMRATAATDSTDVRVGVLVGGTAVAPRVQLYSEPEMSDTNKLSYLVIGRASDGLGGTELAILQQAAVALLAGEGEGATTKFTKAIGLDALSVRQGAGGNLQSAIVTVGKQISSRWYVGYERGLNATAGNFQLVYRLARRLTVRGQSGLDSSIDVIWTWRWQ